jgi:hypothetical protein
MRNKTRQQFYEYMLSDAPRAINDWAVCAWVSKGKLMIDEYGDEPEPTRTYTITVKDIVRGWRMLLELEKAGKWWHCGDDSNPIARTERALIAQDGTEDYDACVIDGVVQLATIGEVIYG